MNDVVIVSGSRTAVGSFGGSLKTVPVVDMGALVMKETLKKVNLRPALSDDMKAGVPEKLKDQGLIDLEKHGADWDDGAAPVVIDEVIMGNVLQTGQGQNPARQAMIRAGICKETPAMSLNKVCGSGLKAIAVGATAIMAGQAEVVLAGGQENMSMVPMALPKARWGYRMELTGAGEVTDLVVFDGLYEIFYGYHMGMTAENIVRMYGISREEQDELGVLSHTRARKAIADGLFKEEIVPVVIKSRKGDIVFDTDERPMDTSIEKMAKLRPAFTKDGSVTAGNASGINDAAAAVLMMTEKGEGAGASAHRQNQGLCRRRSGSGLHGPGAGPRDPKGAEDHRHDHGRPEDDRAERGLRGPGHRLHARARHPCRKAQPAGQRHLHRASHRLHRRPPDGHLHPPHAARKPRDRPGFHVHRRRHGHGHDRRARLAPPLGANRWRRRRDALFFSLLRHLLLLIATVAIRNHIHQRSFSAVRRNSEESNMSISRKLGILVFCGVPAIIGGGILYALFGHSFVPVIIYEALLILAAGAFLSKT
jgi:acetyl-CoA C-acetyltransferase